MQSALGNDVASVCFLCAAKPSKVMKNSIDADLRGEPVSPLSYTEEARARTGQGGATVLHVDLFVGNAQVRNSIVGFAGIDVVKDAFGPIAMHIEPRKAMGVVLCLHDADRHVPKRIKATSRPVRVVALV